MPQSGRGHDPSPDSPMDNAGLQPDGLEGPAGRAAGDAGIALANGPAAPAGLASEPAAPDAAAGPSSFGGPGIGPSVGSAEDDASADLLLADDAPTVGGTLLGRARDPFDHTEWHETPGGTLLAPGEDG